MMFVFMFGNICGIFLCRGVIKNSVKVFNGHRKEICEEKG